MIQSMTGFGKAVTELPNRKITVEIKSLNSKQLDLSTRIPAIYREKEMDIRAEVGRRLERGKIDFNIYVESLGRETSTQINQPIIENYYNQIKDVSKNIGIPLPSDWFQVLLRLPDAIKTEITELEEEETEALMQTVNRALDQLQEFRIQEGEMLQRLFNEKITNIATLLQETNVFELERIDKIKSRINDALSKIENFDYDKNRFEQEMIFYIEKLDVNEEKHRLDNHLKYFIETMENGKGQGKKLGFISQEIGREINTLGSKSNHAELQKIVVRMKDELEQIKEQVLNVM
ncbi:YicC/YloC family endoribonuclease [Coprobacter secundus]|uniref:YicC family protein n=1 Tax=Coprobacter secundus subsp. similis TaxID=2751153 RepID=A0A7G1HWJ4_9BACT|nr:YicC/YloC family endoribonuclease [Coprobacter secundus]KHM46843.1 hypothetical protein PU94_09235 [Coprobacter secundus]BCI62931.1 hypothetical protein Cop2CBH44_12840 [Coprobacter secundus subsp. similis]